MSPLELVGDFERIGQELRASLPVASPALRERVAALRPAPPRRRYRRPSGRLVLCLAAAALLASLVAAGVTRGPHKSTSRNSGAARALERTPLQPNVMRDQAGSSTASGVAILPAGTPARLQRYQATLRLRVQDVDSLSTATKRAQGIARW